MSKQHILIAFDAQNVDKKIAKNRDHDVTAKGQLKGFSRNLLSASYT
jgi:hypothetical protein